MEKNFRKIIGSVVLGISLMAGTVVGMETMDSLSVEAAVIKPKITLKTSEINVNVGSTIAVKNNILKVVAKGSYPIKGYTVIKPATAADAKKVTVKVTKKSKAIPTAKLTFKKAGVAKVRIFATDVKGNKTAKTVKFKVASTKLSAQVKGYVKNNYEIKKGSKAINFAAKCTYSKSLIKSVKVDAARVDYSTVGSYKIYYNITGVNGQKYKVGRTVKVVNPPKKTTTTTTKPSTSTGTSTTKPTTAPTKPTTGVEIEDRTLVNEVTGIAPVYVRMGATNLDVTIMKQLGYNKSEISVELGSSAGFDFPRSTKFGVTAPAGAWNYGVHKLQYQIHKGNRYYFAESQLVVVDSTTAQYLADHGVKVIRTGGAVPTYVQPSEESPIAMGMDQNPHKEVVKVSMITICSEHIEIDSTSDKVLDDHFNNCPDCNGNDMNRNKEGFSFTVDMSY